MSSEATTESSDTRSLFDAFTPPSYADWRKSVDAALKGAPFEKKLITKTYEGIDLQPLYRLEDTLNLPHNDSLPGFAPYVRGTTPLGYVAEPWQVCQELAGPTPSAFNEALTADLERGQTAVNLPLDDATRAGLDADRAEAAAVGRGGVSISSVADLAQALAGVDLEQTPIFIQATTAALPMTALLAALMQQQGKSLSRLRGCVGMDPLGHLARTGSLPRPLAGVYHSMARLAAWATAQAPGLRTVAVQGHPYNDAGATAVQELAFVLASAVEYLRALQERGLDIAVSAPRLGFAFSISSHFFMEIAKLRAARMLWAKIVAAWGGDADAQKMAIHARTSSWNKTVLDPYVNMLRGTVEAFAGVIGGCDSLHVAPFDEVVRPADEFSRRIARNTHTILREESHLGRTVDPVGGSWYVESLTDAVARQAWSLFQAVEKQGGMAKALAAGTPQAQVAEIAGQRTAAIARRRDIFVGANMYANLKESMLEVPVPDSQIVQQERTADIVRVRAGADAGARAQALVKLGARGESMVAAAVEAALAGATLGEIAATVRSDDGPATTVQPLCVQRGAVPFENLRTAAESYANLSGDRCKVFLASMGPLSRHKARSDFTRSFLEVGGFEVQGGTGAGFETVADAARAAVASGAPVVVICATDASYPELVPALTRELKAAKSGLIVLVAGQPGEQADAWRAAGVADFIYAGANCHAILLQLQQKTGVAP